MHRINLRKIPLYTAWLCAVLLNGCIGNGAPSSLTSKGDSETSAANLPSSGLRRLTAVQYQNALNDLLGNDVQVTVPLDSDERLGYLAAVGAGSITTTPQGAVAYDQAARMAAAQVFATPARAQALTTCVPGPSGSDPCVQQFLRTFGQRAWRRPLTASEMDAYAHVHSVTAADASNNGWVGLQTVTAALLASPNFIYRVELGTQLANGTRALNDFELATRLSFLLWNSTPDDALLAVAANNTLHTPSVLSAQTERLIASPRARAALTAFFAEWLAFDALDELTKDPNVFPKFTANLASSMRQEFDANIQALVFDDSADFTELFTQPRTFVNGTLAAFYGLPAPADGNVFTMVTLPATSHRAGLLTSGGFLASQAHNTDTSAVGRGHYVRSRLLCQEVPAPPANVPQLPPSDGTGQAQTMRQRLDAHTASAGCNACHVLMDPAGLALENFDATGAWRANDHGLAIDANALLDGVPIAGGMSLGEVLRQDSRTEECIIRTLYREGLGEMDSSNVAGSIDALSAQFKQSGGSYLALIRAFVASDAFQKAGSLR